MTLSKRLAFHLTWLLAASVICLAGHPQDKLTPNILAMCNTRHRGSVLDNHKPQYYTSGSPDL